MAQRVGFVCLWFAACLCTASPAQAQSREEQTVRSATAVLNEIMAIPAEKIPRSLLAEAQGIAIVPNVIKGGFVVGVRHGRGVVTIRDQTGVWQPPVFVSLTGGSVGWQAGIQSTDVILVFRTRKSLDNLVNGRLTIGVDAAAAAGPVGRQAAAATDLRLAAEILSYSRSRGLFAGVSLDGSVLQADHMAGFAYYQSAVTPGGQPAAATHALPQSAAQLVNQVAQYTSAPQTVPAPETWINGTPFPPNQVIVPDAVAPRNSLVTAARRLSPLLDEAWKSYLAIPAELFTSHQEPSRDALQESLRRFDAIAADPRYRSLANRAEFQTTHRALREYVQSRPRVPVDATLNLPPPPRGAVSQARPRQ